MSQPRFVTLRGARAHNLKGLHVRIPHGSLCAVTGVSGSGKSSLAVDCLLLEARRRYLGAAAGPALQRLGRLGRAQIEGAEGLRAGVLLGQAPPAGGLRSTVGTLSGLLDLLRLLLARVGTRPCLACGATLDRAETCPVCGAAAPALTAGLLSFNRRQGACPACDGVGLQDRVDPELLVAHPERGLRQGALVPTTPKPYIVYSQVTMEVLDQVCRAHGFTVDTPWQELTGEQRAVVLHGSDRIKVPFGKHPLESRMRWSGITARPREEGHYKGIITIIEGILAAGKRNPGVLRFVRSVPCGACGGTRLSPAARAVTLGGRSLPDWTALPTAVLARALGELDLGPRAQAIATPLVEASQARLADLADLGLGHLRLDRPTDSLSGGEARRVQLATCLAGGLGGLIYVLDEPSAGLHPVEQARLAGVLARLTGQGNTVVMVEHEPGLLRVADWLVDVGPGAGTAGGQLLYQGPPAPWLAGEGEGSPTRDALRRAGLPADLPDPAPGRGHLVLRGARTHNLRTVDLELPLGCLVALTGVSGAGKTSLAVDTLVPALLRHLGQTGPAPGAFEALEGAAALKGVVLVDASPIGRSPRSNAGTYTGIFDAVRALFARQPIALEWGFTAGRFSFNTAGGRCERCEGAGSLRVGMHLLPDVHVPCPACGGARFDAETLAVRYRGHSVHDVLELPAAEALALFVEEPAIARGLQALVDLGLGYLPLGQPATTLSGGEAQRVKLAAQLARPPRGRTLYVLDEPSTGLHPEDLRVLVAALRRLVVTGHSLLVADHDLDLLLAADWIVDLGPGGGEEGGRIVGAGTPADLAECGTSPTARALMARIIGEASKIQNPSPSGRGCGEAAGEGPGPGARPEPPGAIALRGVATHNLAGLDLDLPHGALTVITGVSGSGKSSLAFDSLHAEAWRRFGATLPGEARRRLQRLPRPALGTAEGLLPPVAVGQRPPGRNPRSTLGSLAGVLPALRLLFARFGERVCPDCGIPLEGEACPSCGQPAPALTAGHFSFNREIGVCSACDGLGRVLRCHPEALISHPQRPLADGALEGSRFGRYLGEPQGQHMATLTAAAAGLGLSVAEPWCELAPEAQRLALEGSGERVWEVRWRYRRGKREGEHTFTGPWPGMLALVETEWARVHADGRAADLDPLMTERSCATCGGERLAPWPRAVRLGGMRLGELCHEPAAALLVRLRDWEAGELQEPLRGASAAPRALVAERLEALVDLGLGYLNMHRASDSLSGGELRRAQLAGLLASGLSGMQCVLDEPTQGLHPRDVARLVAALRSLAACGNAVVVVEHDLQVIAAADRVVELGPGAGASGGRLVADGPPEALGDTLTGAWLAGRRLLPPRAPAPLDGAPITLRGVQRNNLRDLDLTLPTRGLLGICGVSGSGKSTLLFEVLEPSARLGRPVACREAAGLAQFREVVTVDARPPGDSALSTPATLAGLLRPLAAHFAAHAPGVRPAELVYTSPRGRCTACGGTGRVAVGLELLADAWLPCEACGGTRVRPEALAVHVDGLDIAQALDLSVDAAAARFGRVRDLGPRLAALAELGLGYLPLGQPAATLSGGEARRLRLALALLDGGPSPRLFLLDEPSVGLHPEDQTRLLPLLDRLVRAGDTVILVDHDPGLLRRCDHVVELGPEGGPGGGRVISQGAAQT